MGCGTETSFRNVSCIPRATGLYSGSEAFCLVIVRIRNLSEVSDPDERERYAAEAERMAADHEPADTI
ncbi:MAG: hypothetical protein ACI8XM_001162 [Haloarculaceae archaeon]|jgi:hypothetical protein